MLGGSMFLTRLSILLAGCTCTVASALYPGVDTVASLIFMFSFSMLSFSNASEDVGDEVPRLIRRPFDMETNEFVKIPQSVLKKHLDANGDPLPSTDEDLELEMDKLFTVDPDVIEKHSEQIARSVESFKQTSHKPGKILIALTDMIRNPLQKSPESARDAVEVDKNIEIRVRNALRSNLLEEHNIIDSIKVLQGVGLVVMEFHPESSEEVVRETIKSLWHTTPSAWLIEADSSLKFRGFDDDTIPLSSLTDTNAPTNTELPNAKDEDVLHKKMDINEYFNIIENNTGLIGAIETLEPQKSKHAHTRKPTGDDTRPPKAQRNARKMRKDTKLHAQSLKADPPTTPEKSSKVNQKKNKRLNKKKKPTDSNFASPYPEELIDPADLQAHGDIDTHTEHLDFIPYPPRHLEADPTDNFEEEEKSPASSTPQHTHTHGYASLEKSSTFSSPTFSEFAAYGEDMSPLEGLADASSSREHEETAGHRAAAVYRGKAPNDMHFSRQWALTDPRFSANVSAAWSMLYGVENSNFRKNQQVEENEDLIVALIDTGVDYRHEDLKNQMWKNVKEIPNNGIDDDGNGYVDDFHGYDFERGRPDPMDEHGHGTHVAGILAATANNRIGITGVNWRVRVMPLRFEKRSSAAVEAINYSLKMGAKVSTNSWGFSTESEALRLALDNAAKKGQLFVTAVDNAGKNNSNNDDFPPNWGWDSRSQEGYRNIIRVANLAPNGKLAPSSNYGPYNVDIAAPGTNILSTLPERQFGDKYGFKTGTSMATPLVAGVAAMVWAMRPQMSSSEVRDILMETALQLPELKGKVISEGTVNAFAAVEYTRTLNEQSKGIFTQLNKKTKQSAPTHTQAPADAPASGSSIAHDSKNFANLYPDMLSMFEVKGDPEKSAAEPQAFPFIGNGITSLLNSIQALKLFG